MGCTTCGAIPAPGARFCDRCGERLATADERAAAASAAAWSPDDGDRRIVSALFADLVDYVRMVAEHDPEDVRRRVRSALRAMADAVERFDGTREKFIGDAVFAVFGWPQAHDDDAVRAALAALAIRATLRDLADGEDPLEVRIGIATGEVVAGSVADAGPDDLALTGSAITTAARIQSLARPGEILLDAATVAAARGRLVVGDRGSVVLRGQQESVHLHVLEGELAIGGYGLARPRVGGPIIGRHPERARLRDLLTEVAGGGPGGAVLVVGDAGIGKTRLFADLEADARAGGVAWTWTESTSYGQAEPYRFARVFAQAVADEHAVDSGAFARSLLFTPDLDSAEIRRYGGAIATIARDAAFSGWEAETPDMPSDPAAVKATLLQVAGRYVDRLLATAGPRVVILDDVHWLDRSSDGMVEVLVEAAARLPVLVLASMRPDASPPWAMADHVIRIDLGGLSLPETGRLATEVAEAAVDSEDARRIFERTGGNPLFIAETVRASLEDGSLARRDGRVSRTDGLPDTLPVTLRAVLGARIDALPRDARDVLGVAAVVGMRFRWAQIERLLAGVSGEHTADRLVAAGLIVPAGEDAWRFSHPLVHDAAYVGVLASRRRTLHARIADELEAAGDPLLLDLIAIHRAASGDATRAIPLLEQAADAALGIGAATEAAAFWRTAAELTADAAVAADYRSRAAAALSSRSAVIGS